MKEKKKRMKMMNEGKRVMKVLGSKRHSWTRVGSNNSLLPNLKPRFDEKRVREYHSLCIYRGKKSSLAWRSSWWVFTNLFSRQTTAIRKISNKIFICPLRSKKNFWTLEIICEPGICLGWVSCSFLGGLWRVIFMLDTVHCRPFVTKLFWNGR